MWESKAGTLEADELAVWVELIAAYEDKHHNIGYPSPAEAISAELGERGWAHGDLELELGWEPGQLQMLLNDVLDVQVRLREVGRLLGLHFEGICQQTDEGPDHKPEQGSETTVLK